MSIGAFPTWGGAVGGSDGQEELFQRARVRSGGVIAGLRGWLCKGVGVMLTRAFPTWGGEGGGSDGQKELFQRTRVGIGGVITGS